MTPLSKAPPTFRVLASRSTRRRERRKNPHVESLAVAFEIDVGQLSSLKKGVSGSVPRPEKKPSRGRAYLDVHELDLVFWGDILVLGRQSLLELRDLSLEGGDFSLQRGMLKETVQMNEHQV